MKHASHLPLWSSASARVQRLNPQHPSASFRTGVMGFPPGVDPFSEQAGRTGHCGQLWPRGPSHLPTQPAAAEADIVLDLTHKGEPLVSAQHSPNPKDPIPEGRGSQYQRHSPCGSGLWGVGQAAPCSLNWETGPDMPALKVMWTAEDLHAEAQATSFKNESISSWRLQRATL